MRCFSRRSSALACALVLAVPAVAAADAKAKKQAKAHIESAMKAHGDGNFDVALTELESAYKLDPDPELLYAIGQVHSKLGHCDDAKSYYARYQQTNKDPAVTGVIDQAIAGCQPTAPPPPPPVETPPPAPGPTTSGRAPWYRDYVGDALVGAGVIATVVGVVVYSSARSDLDAAEAAPDLPRYQALVDDAHSKRTLSIVLVGGGVALVGAGVAHYVFRGAGRSAEVAPAPVAISPTRGGGLVTWTGSF